MKHRIFFFLLFTCTLFCACKWRNPFKASTGEMPRPIEVPCDLYYDPDSLLSYAKRAYLRDDPQGLYVTGAAAYLRALDPDFPEYCTTVPLYEASIMLKHAVELGHADAQDLIDYLQKCGVWEELQN